MKSSIRTAERTLPAPDYALADTLGSGQAFRWRETGGAWEGVIHQRWVRLSQGDETIRAEMAAPAAEADWRLLEEYLQNRIDINEVTATFPADEHLTRAVEACRGLRLLRQEPWECLASFILSSTKQIVQIQQIVEALCSRFGEAVRVPDGRSAAWAFPSVERISALTETELRCCKMGFRAPYLKGTAEALLEGRVKLAEVQSLPLEEARAALMSLPGVGRKIADCVLLFGFGFQRAFPVDVWVLKALRELYFPRRRPSPKRLIQFTESYFGPRSGYAQQYLFHYMRTKVGRKSS